MSEFYNNFVLCIFIIIGQVEVSSWFLWEV